MRKRNQFSITVHKDTGKEFVRVRDEIGITSDELLAQMIELYRPRAWFFKLLNKAFRWI